MTGRLPVLLFDGRTLLFGSPSIPYKTVVVFSAMLVLFYFLILTKYALTFSVYLKHHHLCEALSAYFRHLIFFFFCAMFVLITIL